MEYLDILDEKGEFTNKTASREECHEKGYWHRAVYCFIFNSNGDVLLQKRSASKKLWPNLWDVTAGGHVLAGEFGEQALIREVKEELGIDIESENIRYLVGSSSTNIQGNIINNHYNECYIVTKDVDIKDVKLQSEEVSEIKWISREEIIDRINNDYDGITTKTGVWNFLKKYYEHLKK